MDEEFPYETKPILLVPLTHVAVVFFAHVTELFSRKENFKCNRSQALDWLEIRVYQTSFYKEITRRIFSLWLRESK